MKTLSVAARSQSYDVKIASGILDAVGAAVKTYTDAERCIVVSGTNVFPLYGERALASLRKEGLIAESIVFPAGEGTKSFRSYERLLNFIAEHHLTRSDCLIALGGGVTGDLTGFAAATWQRGIPYIQIPTTLLAAVDSSVGGKTAINITAGKNQVGAFWQPAAVLCDPDTLKTLPDREVRAGFAEVIKYACLGNADLFDGLQRRSHPVEELIEICIRMKAEIVAEDEYDNGRRRLLNFGHTIGHAIEQRSGYMLLHGEAVSVGMAMICRAAVQMKYMDEASKEAVISLLCEYGLPTEPQYLADELYDLILADKKVSSGKLHLIVPRAIGWCADVPVDPEQMKEWLLAAYE